VASCGNAVSDLGLSRCSETSGALKVPERVPIPECSMHAARYIDVFDRVNESKRCAQGLLAPDRSFASAPFATIEGQLRNILSGAVSGATHSLVVACISPSLYFPPLSINHAPSALPRRRVSVPLGDAVSPSRSARSPPLSSSAAVHRVHQPLRLSDKAAGDVFQVRFSFLRIIPCPIRCHALSLNHLSRAGHGKGYASGTTSTIGCLEAEEI
jgi:hypothetical protein